MMFVGMAMIPTVLLFESIRIYTGASKLNPYSINASERPFEYYEWSKDLKGIRGEWNNNFYCWSDNPDCGKDYKPKYIS